VALTPRVLDWRDLHGPLAQLFADYEPGIHLSQLQMQAGIVGINTMRVYNVNKQLLEQDPQGIFCRRYVAPLRKVPMADWLNPLHNIAGYPRPIVRAHANIEQMKQQIMAIRKSEAAKEPTRQVLQQHGSRAWRNDRNSRPARRKSHKKVSKDQLSLDL
jgi:deoxyribodipyrimidine photo-lyase